jgi:hypothetical protein
MLKISGKNLLVLSAIFFVALSRLLPHLPNFTPLAAMALFGGAFLSNKKSAFLFTFTALFLSDFLVNIFLYNDDNFINYLSQPFVWAIYASFGLTVWMGISIQNNISIKNVVFFSISSSLLFWIITNFACWPNNPLYAQNINGLISCYIAAIPYLGNVIGDLFYNTILFGTVVLFTKRTPAYIKL